MKIKLLLLLLFLVTGFSSFAGEKIDKEQWKRLKREVRYERESDKGEKENWADEYDRNNSEKSFGEEDFDKYLKGRRSEKEEINRNVRMGEYEMPGFITYLIIIVVGIILALVIYYLFKDKKIKGNKKIILENADEAQIEKPYDELEELLKKSIESGNYREAVRIYFIFIIKYLREKKMDYLGKKKDQYSLSF